MAYNPDFDTLPALTNPTDADTLFVVLDKSVAQTLTVTRARSLLAVQGDAGPTLQVVSSE